MNVHSNDRSKSPATHSNGTGDPGQLAEGTKVGGVFLLKEQLIESPEAPVWLAEDELLGKDVALHFLPRRLGADQKALVAIGQAIKRSRQLVHPNIVRAYDVVVDGDLVAISTEQFKGKLLSAVLRERESQFFEPAEAKPFLRQLFQTVADAHRINAVHGHVRLENIILTPEQRVLLRHFGTGGIIEAGAAAATVPTVSDDVHGLGITIYQLLSGEPPAPPSDPAATAPTIMEARARSNRRGGTILPVWEKVVASALSGAPADRPASVVEMGERLGLLEKRGMRVAAAAAPVIESTTAPELDPTAEPEIPPKPETAPVAEHQTPSAPVAPVRSGHRSTPSSRIGVQPRKPWIPEARLASDDDFLTDDAPESEPTSPVHAIPFNPGLPKRTKRILRIAAAVLLLGIVAGGVLFFRKPDNADHSARSHPAVPANSDSAVPSAAPTGENRLTSAAHGTPISLPGAVAGGIEAEIQRQEFLVSAADEAASSARRTAEEKYRELEAAKAALAKLRERAKTNNSLAAPAVTDLAEDSLMPALPEKDGSPGGEDEPGLLGSDGELHTATADSSAGAASRGAAGPAVPPSTLMEVAKLDVQGGTVSKAAAAGASSQSPPVAAEVNSRETAQEDALENSLGMKFAPVGGLHFCIWPTRVQDYATYAQEVRLKSTAWRQPGFKQGPDHPVIRISWNHAAAFCKWLTERERSLGKLNENEVYRLPTDAEWSVAVGLPEEPGTYPSERDGKIAEVYPWAGDWPPSSDGGNYNGQETGERNAIPGFTDGFVKTSPVGAFPANRNGLHDLGGNVWEWCSDYWKKGTTARVLRGGSYKDSERKTLWSSTRLHAAPDSMTYNYGFRIVRAPAPPPRKKP